jgi:hypothetical protein
VDKKPNLNKVNQVVCRRRENVVAVDKAHVGGKFASMHKTKRQKHLDAGVSNKTPIKGMVEQRGKARLFVIGNASYKDLVRKNISFDVTLVTDEHLGYQGLINEYKEHAAVNHSQLEFKKDGFSTNSVEGFFSLFKRMYIGTYHVMSPYHLNRYCQEHACGYNTRKIKDGLRFLDVMSKTKRRLKYKDLIASKPEPLKPPTKGINFIGG